MILESTSPRNLNLVAVSLFRIGGGEMYLYCVGRGEIDHRLLLPFKGNFGSCVIRALLSRSLIEIIKGRV